MIDFGGFLPDTVRDNGGDVLWVTTGVAALLSLYLLIQKNWPSVARRVRAVVRFVWRWLILAAPRFCWWVWRKLSTDENGVRRGPIRRMGEAIEHRLASVVHQVTAPRFDDQDRQLAANAARSSAQHDEQNMRFDKIDQRLDRGAQSIDDLTGRITAVEDLVTNPPPRLPGVRTRANDG